MIYIGYAIAFLALIRLLVASINNLTRIHLPKCSAIEEEPLISILIPARNEEKSIKNLLSDIKRLSYTNYQVIVYDDSSTDRTAEIVREYCLTNSKIELIDGKPLESGWLGKSYACYQLSLIARGEYYLFLDADVRVNGDLLEQSLCYSGKHKLGLLSIFPKQIMNTFGEALSVPTMNRILLSLLPLVLVRVSSRASLSAANGQFMFFDADIYQRAQPHAECRSAKAEDIAICSYYKREGVAVGTLLGDQNIRCRMYKSLQEAVNGFSKNVFAFFGNSISITLLYALYTTFAPFVLLVIFGYEVFFAYIISLLVIQVLVSLSSRQTVWCNVILLPLQHFVFLWIILSALFKHASKTMEWKGRNITEI